jgi:hypothetical protein
VGHASMVRVARGAVLDGQGGRWRRPRWLGQQVVQTSMVRVAGGADLDDQSGRWCDLDGQGGRWCRLRWLEWQATQTSMVRAAGGADLDGQGGRWCRRRWSGRPLLACMSEGVTAPRCCVSKMNGRPAAICCPL